MHKPLDHDLTWALPLLPTIANASLNAMAFALNSFTCYTPFLMDDVSHSTYKYSHISWNSVVQ